MTSPNDFDSMEVENDLNFDVRVEVVNETTFGAAFRMHQEQEDKIVCLNFASAKNPGGGFLGGSQAQEESLARSSALYPCIKQIADYYEFHRAGKSCLYSDRMIYSPEVPVFRNDQNELLNNFYTVSIVTAPAVNCIKVNRKDAFEAMDIRIEKLLTLCAARGHRNLILGAWGCGVFRNDPSDIAGLFKKHLCENEKFVGLFERVVFAVLDNSKSKKIFKSFERTFI